MFCSVCMQLFNPSFLLGNISLENAVGWSLFILSLTMYPLVDHNLSDATEVHWQTRYFLITRLTPARKLLLIPKPPLTKILSKRNTLHCLSKVCFTLREEWRLESHNCRVLVAYMSRVYLQPVVSSRGGLAHLGIGTFPGGPLPN
jgi:hypothetical protein